jgi:hypothetical protein
MKPNKTIYFLMSMVIILIIVNIFTLGFFIFREDQHPPKFGCEREPGDYLVRELGFNDAQKKLFDGYRHEHHSAVQPIMDQISSEKDRFFSELKKDQLDSLKIDSLSRTISSLHQKVDVITFWHFNKIRKMCDEKQKAHFDEMIKEGIALPKGHGKHGHLME